MLGFVLIALAIVVAGCGLVERFWRDDLSLPERITAGAVAGLALWLAVHWVLAATHTLTTGTIGATAILFILVAAWAVWSHRAKLENVHVDSHAAMATMALFFSMLSWLIYVLWRALVIGPQNHDALAYHLPKAVLMLRTHGYERFAAPDLRIGTTPANYELLLADVLALAGEDRLTEWIGTATFLLFLIAAAAIARRWTSGVAGALATVFATAAAPVILLHSGADKNDLLCAFFALAALLFGARWVVQGGRAPAALAIVAATAGLGTKANLAAVAAGLLPFALLRGWRLLRTRTLRAADVARAAGFVVAAFLLCGGWSYIANWTAPSASAANAQAVLSPTLVALKYGDWFNLWQFPWLLLTIPFAPGKHGVWAPWAGEYWFWPHYELFWSHYGFLFTIAAVALPLALWRYRAMPDDRRAERRVASLAALIAVAIMLPVASRPIGLYGTYPRYMLFVVPLLFAWTFAPIADELWQRRRGVAHGFLALIAAAFLWTAVQCADKDAFAPLDFVQWAVKYPGTRTIAFMGGRAASIADRRAGPDDTIAVEGAFETWVYPAYGAKLTRPVIFLPPNPTPADVPPTAEWVIVDRSWSSIWAPTMKDMGDGWKQLGKGKPFPDEVRFLEAMKKDPRFRLVYQNPSFNQAVFRRIAPPR